MPKRSLFRDFISALRRHWRTDLPQIQPLRITAGPMMPKASTLYAGFSARHDLYVFINFQHSSKAWEVGRFTINLILSKHEREPETWGGPFAPEDGKSFAEGSYRISGVLGQHPEKWWHLKKDRRPIITQAWRPTSYDDNAVVLNDS